MLSLNRFTGMGYVTKDLKLETSEKGTQYLWLPFCINDTYTDKNGKKIETPQFLSCKAFGKTAEACALFLKKGSAIYIECKAKMNEWEKDGVKKKEMVFILEKVQFLDRKGDSETKVDLKQDEEEVAF